MTRREAIDEAAKRPLTEAVGLRNELLHIITRENRRPGSNASALAIMFEALDRAETDPRGLFDGLCENFCGRLAHKLLIAAGFEVTEETWRRIK